jgi:hypothetical protein
MSVVAGAASAPRPSARVSPSLSLLLGTPEVTISLLPGNHLSGLVPLAANSVHASDACSPAPPPAHAAVPMGMLAMRLTALANNCLALPGRQSHRGGCSCVHAHAPHPANARAASRMNLPADALCLSSLSATTWGGNFLRRGPRRGRSGPPYTGIAAHLPGDADVEAALVNARAHLHRQTIKSEHSACSLVAHSKWLQTRASHP